MKDSGEKLQAFAGEQRPALLNTFFRVPKRGVSYTFQSLNASKSCYRSDYIISRQKDCRLSRVVSVHRPPVLRPESDHNLVYATIRLHGRFAANRAKLDAIQKRRGVDLSKLMADPKLTNVL